MIDICHYTCVKTHRIITPGMNCYGNYELWVIKMCQYRLMDCKKCTMLEEDVDNEGGYAYGGGRERVHRNSLYLLLNFTVNLK